MWYVLRDGMRRYRAQLLIAYAIHMTAWVAILSEPYFIAQILDKALPAASLPLFLRYASGFFLCLAVHLLCAFGRPIYLWPATEGIFLELRSRLVSTVLNKPAQFHARHETGDLLTRISNDTETLALYLSERIFWMAASMLMITGCIGFLLIWNHLLGLLALLSLPCYAALLAVTRGPLSRAALRARRKLSEQNAVLLDLLAGVHDIRFYQQARPGAARFRSAAEEFTRANVRAARINDWAVGGNDVFCELVSFMPFLVGGLLICMRIGGLTIGTLVAYNIYLVNIMIALSQLLAGITCLSRAEPILGRIRDILEEPEERRPEAREIGLVPDQPRIEFRDLSYHPPGRNAVLNGFNLIIEPGEKIALMGPSGSGKTTLLDLLARRIAPTQGEILFGGRTIEQYSLALYLYHFAYMTQRPHLFRVSLRENIAMGWYHIPEDVIVEASRHVHLHDTISMLPAGYDTVIDDHEGGLSGGQKQQLLLARALVHEASVLLLDEFTSALDHQVEEMILDTLFEAFPSATIICATHSDAVARRFSRVVHLPKQ
jgi:ABC-type bacteriocin/lantibiotic exporter with double-glycine peptidase domain